MTKPSDNGGAAWWAQLPQTPESDIVDRADVDRFVRDFYRQAAMDEVLGPVFAATEMNWNAHIETLIDFWSWQLFGERDYTGNPLREHEPVNARTPFTAEHYERWLELFEGTVANAFVGPVAELAKARARKMVTALRRLLTAVSPGGDTPVEATLVRGR
jgi:hemoglobin